MRILLYVFLLVMIGSFVSATQVIPIDHSITVDFRDPTSFNLVFDNGFEKHFQWDTNETESDSTFTYRYYHSLDENSFCAQYTSCNEYENITLKLSNMLDICGDIVKTWNNSDNYRAETQEAIKDRDTYELMLESCEYDRDNLENESVEYKNDMVYYRDELDSCETDLSRVERTSGDVQECNSDLDKAVSDKNTFGFGGLAIGLAAGYMLWKRKPASGPSEQAEAGISTDMPSFNIGDSPRD